MTTKNKLVNVFFVIIFSLSSGAHAVDTTNTADVMSNTLQCQDCMDWKLVGICFWLECHLFDCEVNESVKIGHYIPDLLITSYTTNHSPMKELDGINNVSTANLTQSHSDQRQYDGPLNFKNTEVIGNPAVIVFNELADNSDYFCHSVVEYPFYPYYFSSLDTFWNAPSFEHLFPQAIFASPKIETNWPLGYWAQVYPLSGWGSHPYDPINAAVAAHRAAMIVVNNELHVHLDPGKKCGNKCWPPGDIKTNQLSTHKFQMVFPVVEDKGMVMGGSATWANGKNKALDEGYVWSLWRPYTCCKSKGQFFIGSVDF